MPELFDKSKKEALALLSSWRKQLLILFDTQCEEGQEDFDQIFQEILDFSEKIFKNTFPNQLELMIQVPSTTGYSEIDQEQNESTKQQTCIDTIVAVDELLDKWVLTIKKKGMPSKKVLPKEET
ncbi:MAG: hypothetical protein KAR20_22210 [Candidatus Heimdallarchaeota archaeon]|nr:hypothetical protein [Candidatus Heimdallarchaeota archaeon]